MECERFCTKLAQRCESSIYLPNGSLASTNKDITVMTEVGFEESKTRLTIHSFKKSRDAGSYRCGSIAKSVIFVSNPYLNVRKSALKVDVSMKQGKTTAGISIDYEAYPPPTFTWFSSTGRVLAKFDKESSQFSENFHLVSNYSETNYALQINGVSGKNSGSFTLSVSNIAGVRNVSVELTISGSLIWLSLYSFESYFKLN